MSDKCQCYAVVTNPQRQEMWKRIFPPDGEVPITCPIPVGQGNLAGTRSPFYLIDFSRVTPEQRSRLIDEVSLKFNLPKSEVESEIAEKGVPVMATDVMVSWCSLHTRCVM